MMAFQLENRVSKPDAILIAGPTASGKSRLALDTVRRVGGEIVNTDSMQIYDVLRVLTARPSVEDEVVTPHHLYGFVSPSESFSVAKWQSQATAIADEIGSRGKVPVFVGGTGLYFKALEKGLADVPDIPEGIRVQIRQALIEDGSAALYQRLRSVDAESAAGLRPSDGQRIARALEVFETTGKSLKSFQEVAQSVSFLKGRRVVKVLLMPERSKLHERINLRTAQMMQQGAVEEVRELLALNLPSDASAMQAIGVKPLRAHLEGEIAMEEAIEKIRAATRQYAKRQSTWFRGQHGDDWRLFETAEEALDQFSG